MKIAALAMTENAYPLRVSSYRTNLSKTALLDNTCEFLQRGDLHIRRYVPLAVFPLSVQPDAPNASRLSADDVPLQTIADHDGFLRRRAEAAQRVVEYPPIGFCGADFAGNDNDVEMVCQTRAAKLFLLVVGQTVRDEGQFVLAMDFLQDVFHIGKQGVTRPALCAEDLCQLLCEGWVADAVFLEGAVPRASAILRRPLTKRRETGIIPEKPRPESLPRTHPEGASVRCRSRCMPKAARLTPNSLVQRNDIHPVPFVSTSARGKKGLGCRFPIQHERVIEVEKNRRRSHELPHRQWCIVPRRLCKFLFDRDVGKVACHLYSRPKRLVQDNVERIIEEARPLLSGHKQVRERAPRRIRASRQRPQSRERQSKAVLTVHRAYARMRPPETNRDTAMTTFRNVLLILLVASALVPASGCARAARNTEGFATADTAVVEAPYPETWQAVKATLRDEGYDIYTRDRRGVFVAYSDAKRRRLVPHRVQYTITLEGASPQSTKVTVETLRQVYGVTLLTHPGWHDRKTTDSTKAKALLEAIADRVAAAPQPAAAE